MSIVTSPSQKLEELNYLSKRKKCNLGAGFCVSVILNFGLLLNLIFFATPQGTLDGLSQDLCSMAILQPKAICSSEEGSPFYLTFYLNPELC